jgi:hypothetical protein
VLPTATPSVTIAKGVPDIFVSMPYPIPVAYSAARDYYEKLKALVYDIWAKGLMRPAPGSSHPI